MLLAEQRKRGMYSIGPRWTTGFGLGFEATSNLVSGVGYGYTVLLGV